MARLLRAALSMASFLSAGNIVNGSDSNNGTSMATPWRHAPRLPECTGNRASHTPVAGDQFIFRGVAFELNGPAVTATGNADLCFSNVAFTNAVSASLPSGIELTYGRVMFSSTNGGAATLLTTSAASHNVAWTDAASIGSFN
jgi:hypothetical protein